MSVVIETTIGDITVDLFVEERPRACLNFLKLCKLKYYNYNLFHNIERNFIAQTGDPTGAGDGGESVWGLTEGLHKRFFEAENLPKIKHDVPGLLSLVSIGKRMVSSQFFFTLGQDLISLDNIHCVIGEVVEGHEILRKLNESIVDAKFRPYQDIRITHTVVLDDPFDDPRGLRVPSRSPSPAPQRFLNGRIAADENIDDTEGKTIQEIQEIFAEREAKARATILEIVGDLPDAEIAPPENVLFVCKLNPVTTEDDLEIIFSRFGKVIGCEVIKDKVSGDSLQYAFVEFDDKKSCEAAYFKMDNVLIDDRRIHVDFSQSVAKVQWKGKGRGLIHHDGKDDRKLDFNNYKERREPKRDERYNDNKRYNNNTSRRNYDSRRKSRSLSPNRSQNRTRNYNDNRKKSNHGRKSRSPSPNQHRFGSRNYNDNRKDSNQGPRYEKRYSRSRSRSRPRYNESHRQPTKKTRRSKSPISYSRHSSPSRDRRYQNRNRNEERSPNNRKKKNQDTDSRSTENRSTSNKHNKYKKSKKHKSSTDSSSSSSDSGKKRKKHSKKKRHSSTSS